MSTECPSFFGKKIHFSLFIHHFQLCPVKSHSLYDLQWFSAELFKTSGVNNVIRFSHNRLPCAPKFKASNWSSRHASFLERRLKKNIPRRKKKRDLALGWGERSRVTNNSSGREEATIFEREVARFHSRSEQIARTPQNVIGRVNELWIDKLLFVIRDVTLSTRSTCLKLLYVVFSQNRQSF